MLIEIILLLFLILLNGVFAMAELALVGARKTRLQASANNGHRGAVAALALLNKSGRFLSTVSIGITLIGVSVSTIGGDSFAIPLAAAIETIPALADYSHAIAVGLIVITISFMTIVVGELVPKRIAIAHPEAISIFLARFMTVVTIVVSPAEWFLSGATDLVLKLLPLSGGKSAPVTDEEINLMMREGAAAGEFHEAESAIVQMALRLGDRHVDAIMTPRTQVELLDIEDGLEDNLAKIKASDLSRFPVVEGGPENVVGILQVKDLLAASLSGQPIDLRALIRPPLYVPNTVPALKLLETLRKSGEPLALIVDEYGDFDGLVTLHDILQALVGDIAELGEPGEQGIIRHEDGSWLIDGLTPVDDVKDALGLKNLPEEDTGDFHTLGGFLMARMKRVPKVADHISVEGWRFEVKEMDGHRVDKVLVVPPAAA
ncbi:MAG TPA: hemolysin family protein [Aliidongia sp.]|uniref:hemolysin family protein n=1 Tax=Aliidongia sp. TaxID=1914230 RepID=UPI002DDCC163|nr:hemolysin family protein [Aliidongia sp.]HEV2678373.1 hemolysin family protein [Aliidongia sp.]